MKIVKIALRAAVVLAVAAAVSSCFVGKYMVNYALLPEEHGQKFDEDRLKVESRYPGLLAWYDDLYAKGVFKDTTIVGEGGFKLHAVYAPAADPSTANTTAIFVHGYTDNYLCFLNFARMYRDDLNVNVLLPDLHYHGLSEGRAIQMGWLDRLDIKRWIPVAHNIFGDDKMIVHGISMGAATTMMLSGEDDLPSYVKGFIEDCGYTSAWDQFADNLKASFHLPTFPVLNSASIVCKQKYGWSFKEASALKQVAKSTLPMLFIHGDEDDFVPTRFVYPLYEAKTIGYKELWIVENTPKHAFSYHDHPVEYTAKVRDFLGRL